MAITAHTASEQFKDAIENAVKTEIAAVSQTIVEDAQRDLEVAIKKALGVIALRVLDHYSIERNGRDLIIRVMNDVSTGEQS